MLYKMRFFLILIILINFKFDRLYSIMFPYEHTFFYFKDDLIKINENNDNFNPIIEQDELLSSIDDFVGVPEGGTSWKIFGETEMNEYTVMDSEGIEWIGFRPMFKENLKKLDGKKILIQGFMFPLEQKKKQKLFLLGPFPATCPYHFHVDSNLVIEVHADSPVEVSYDVINIRGKLELVQRDDEFNIFYRLKESKLVKN
mgnify:CR=1 FL=1